MRGKTQRGFRKTLAFADVISFFFAGGKFLCGLGGHGDHVGSGDLPRTSSKGNINICAMHHISTHGSFLGWGPVCTESLEARIV